MCGGSQTTIDDYRKKLELSSATPPAKITTHPIPGARVDEIEACLVHLRTAGFGPRRALLERADHGRAPPSVSIRA
jgi:hypothetical protein